MYWKNLKKIQITDSTTFFHEGKAVLWYTVYKGRTEFFTFPWIHPVSKDALSPVTAKMMENYAVKKQDSTRKK
ncbi:hypothetical protein ED312_14415 [Sinomicrobium pectinilyticum]|uniref:Uncharacterized protein n=1 Tax=Sinomicrobium pectinilyticum TaxID=1084421 RepID=A0A3N0E8F5_SINP1|nr:hypothetical protein ED312_14415 [Sinomicrobium pectinilyticum]